MPKIFFKVHIKDEIKDVYYDSSITIEEFLKDFSAKNNITYKSNEYKIACGSKLLNSDQNLGKKLGALIKNNSIIKIESTGNIIGGTIGFGMETIDVSNNKTKEYGVAYSNKKHQVAGCGLSIKSECKNERCDVYNDVVYVTIGYVEKWNLVSNHEEQVICPICKEPVIPINFYFRACNYTIDYTKVTKEKQSKRGSVSGHADNNKYIAFDEDKSGTAFFTRLVFTVTRL